MINEHEVLHNHLNASIFKELEKCRGLCQFCILANAPMVQRKTIDLTSITNTQKCASKSRLHNYFVP